MRSTRWGTTELQVVSTHTSTDENSRSVRVTQHQPQARKRRKIKVPDSPNSRRGPPSDKTIGPKTTGHAPLERARLDLSAVTCCVAESISDQANPWPPPTFFLEGEGLLRRSPILTGFAASGDASVLPTRQSFGGKRFSRDNRGQRTRWEGIKTFDSSTSSP